MGYLFSIETLRLNNNRFVGELPSQFKNCKNLTLFNLAENKLSGSILEWLGASLPNLTILILQSNNFYGSIPQQLCHLTRIQLLDLSRNNISGTIPKCLNSLTTLTQKGSSSQTIQHSFLGDYLGGYILGRYDDEASLTWKGFRAKFKSNLGLLKSIDLSSSKLIGEIPSEITYLELESLDLSRNQINGRIPTSLSRIASLGTQLQSFDYAYGGNPLLCGAPLPRTYPEEEKGLGQPVLVNQDGHGGLITQGYYIIMGLGFGVGFWGVCGALLLNRQTPLRRHASLQLEMPGTKDCSYI
ncbi:putative LRR receptor-like serine/threonine-protein kinase [Prunus yedoensis var. nudiflora]|uniref:Putative LRR receptor-like serine/threonine-protein kinase n=1 Tax=Prunus yedoensis var. nudiflora TaxID=2094558 RepID=A0A314Y3L4_PRUYE|nr:putative LRR receptor-like serine/threonine-protein kinase [Prunus yedoensis var. nudiflora]